jgi:SAM-dependent MidA family methyltransferase
MFIYLHVDLGASPVILAHEFFDALPIHQFRLTEQGWREVLVTADKDKPCDLHLALSKAETSNLILPPSNDDRYRIGDYFEINPEAIYLIKRFSERIARQKSGVALVVDYGYDGIKKTATFRVCVIK